MPIRINLLAEDEALEGLRRKDPVKRAIWLGAFAVFLVLLWGLTLFLKITVVKFELSGLESKWKSMEKNVKQVDENRRRATGIEQNLSALSQFVTNRFLWANALNALQQTCVSNVQLSRLKADQSYLQIEAVKPPAKAAGAGAVARAKPAATVEKIVLHLEGRDYSIQAGEQVSRYKEAMLAFPFFQATLQKTNTIQLASLSPPMADLIKKISFARFDLQLNFQEKERRLNE